MEYNFAYVTCLVNGTENSLGVMCAFSINCHPPFCNDDFLQMVLIFLLDVNCCVYFTNDFSYSSYSELLQ